MYKLIDLHANRLTEAANLWESGWHDAHTKIVPVELAKLRTTESFRQRLRDNLENTRIGVGNGRVLGLCTRRENEIYQMYVAPGARGRGLAQALMTDAEGLMADDGHSLAWLACSVGNLRAARFYEKSGWIKTGVQILGVETPQGDFPLQIWRFEKDLT